MRGGIHALTVALGFKIDELLPLNSEYRASTSTTAWECSSTVLVQAKCYQASLPSPSASEQHHLISSVLKGTMASNAFAGISVVGEVRPPQPASATTAVTYSGYHLLVVNGYSSLKNIPNGKFRESLHFKVGGYRWILQCYPNGYEPFDNGHISFYLFLDQGNVIDPVMVQYEFSFVTNRVHTNNQTLLGRVKGDHKFCNQDAYKLIFLKRKALFEKSNYLKNDSFTVRCDIVINKDVNINEAVSSDIPVSGVLPSPPDIRQDLSDLLQSGVGTDVTFQVGGGMFRAHRCVLAARSAVFKAQLFGPMKEGTTTSVIHIRDMEEQVFKLLLGFIYSDSVPEGDDIEEDEILWQHLIEAADRYDLPRLTLLSEQELCVYINTTTVTTILVVAEQHNCRVLKKVCLDFLNSPSNLQEVIGLDGLDHLVSRCPSVLKDVIMKLNTGRSSAFALPDFVMPKSEMHLDFLSLFESKERTDVTFQVTGEAICAHRCLLAARSGVFRAELFGPMKDTGSDIRQDLGDLLRSGAGADVTFQVGSGMFMAHRCVLAARSAVFKAQLFGPMKEGTTTGVVIRVKDMEEQVFRLLLDFIYSDSVPDVNNTEEDKTMWRHLLEAADRYDLPRLKLICEQELCAWINTSTVATILVLAEKHHCRGLMEACLDFLNSPANLQKVMALDGLEPLVINCPSVLKDLIGKLASLKIDTRDNGAAALPPVIDIPESDMHLHFASLLQSEERTDVTFQVGGEMLHAHRCVLAARSRVFRDVFVGPMKEDTANDVIRIDDMEATVFKLLLTFIYSDSVAEMDKEEKEEVEGNKDDADVMWQQLLVAADRYGVQRLKLVCERKLGSYINTSTVATILALAEQHHCRWLKEECLDFLDIRPHLQQVMEVGGLHRLRRDCPSVLDELIAKLGAFKHDR